MEKVVSIRDRSVLGEPLAPCCNSLKVGFYRDGMCRTGSDDPGSHTVCAIMTQEFLDFSVSRGNDLVTAHPELGFPGLKAGDKWCLCSLRWKEAYAAGKAPPVILEATHERALEDVTLSELRSHVLH